MSRIYYRGAKAAVLCYGEEIKEEFLMIYRWAVGLQWHESELI